jgi:hypothetical protein
MADMVTEALDRSATLIVLCSPASARSRYIDAEVRLFRTRHPDRPIIPVIVEGDFPDNIPPALRHEIMLDGTVTNQSIQLHTIDLRRTGDGLDLGVAKVVCGLIGLNPSEVVRRSAERRRRRLPIFGWMRKRIPPPWERKSRRVDATAYCPKRLKAGESELLQIMVHLRGQRREALCMARAADPSSRPAAPSKDLGELALGDTVAVSLDVTGAKVNDPPTAQKWQGETLTFGFRVATDGQTKYVAISAVLSVNGTHVGRIVFRRPVALQYSFTDVLALIWTPRLSRFKRAFFSYARVDRQRVVPIAREYEKYGISFFQDLLDLDPGERWKRRLYKEIDRCDVFVLFWSCASKNSEWVIKEADRAWRRQARNGGLRPTLRPEVLEHPAPQPDQDWLREFHFDDPKYYRR